MRAMVVALALAGCAGKGAAVATGETGVGGTLTTFTTDPTTASTPGACVSGQSWLLGDHESPLMHPGMDCVDCHVTRGEGPNYVIAGTVFSAFHEPDDCYGRSGVVIEITDADGNVHDLESGSSGNFAVASFEFSPKMPYTAAILVDGAVTNAMVSAQSDGACNSCHTEDGKNSAPGRIIVGD